MEYIDINKCMHKLQMCQLALFKSLLKTFTNTLFVCLIKNLKNENKKDEKEAKMKTPFFLKLQFAFEKEFLKLFIVHC